MIDKNILSNQTLVFTLLLAIILYFIFDAIYNIYIHPLSKVPGPLTWTTSRLPFIHSLLNGTLIQDIQELHNHYGSVVRIAPNEVTFSSPEAWNDIFQHATGHPEFPKDPVWWRKQSDKPNTLPNAIDTKTHTRFRKALAPAFTPRALQSQEPILHRYVDLLVERLRELTQDSSTESVEVDMTSWFNFTAFDIFGDLGFGESFDCLQDSKYHPWISLLFNSVKAASFIAAARFYPIVEVILMKLIPASLKKMANDHYQQIVDKVHRRLNREIQRSDIMSHLIDKIGEDNGMTLDEVNATFGFLTTAGSETTATVLSGTLNYLIQNPEKMTILVRELREAFNTWDDITLENLGDLFYLNAVLNEGLRLCPPIPWILPRKVPAGGKVICGIWIPGGTSVSIQAYSMNRDPQNFYQSTSFLPERWLPISEKEPASIFSKDKTQSLRPFSFGSRNCMGRHLAMAEMRLIMAKLLWSFDFELVPSKKLKWEELKTFLLVEKEPVYARVTQRG